MFGYFGGKNTQQQQQQQTNKNKQTLSQAQTEWYTSFTGTGLGSASAVSQPTRVREDRLAYIALMISTLVKRTGLTLLLRQSLLHACSWLCYGFADTSLARILSHSLLGSHGQQGEGEGRGLGAWGGGGGGAGGGERMGVWQGWGWRWGAEGGAHGA